MSFWYLGYAAVKVRKRLYVTGMKRPYGHLAVPERPTRAFARVKISLHVMLSEGAKRRSPPKRAMKTPSGRFHRRKHLGLCFYPDKLSTLDNPGSISIYMHCRWSSAVHCFSAVRFPFMFKPEIPSTPALRASAWNDNQERYCRWT